jgi:hypothetical protein
MTGGKIMSLKDPIEKRIEQAMDPKTPSELLARLAKDRAKAVRRAVAENPSATPEILERLGVTRNLSAMQEPLPEILTRLAKDPLATVRRYAAENPSTP